MVSLELRSDLKQVINRLQQTYRNPFKNSSTQSVLSYISPGGDGSIFKKITGMLECVAIEIVSDVMLMLINEFQSKGDKES